MVKVPEYEQSMALRPAYRQDVEVRATPEAFGADAGRGLVGLAKGVEHVADAMAAVRDIEDAARTKDALAGYSKWKRDRLYGENGFMTKEGRNAVDGYSGFEQEAEDKRKQFGQGLTPGAARMYENASKAELNSALNSSIQHTASQRKAWVNQASASRVSTFADDALTNYNKPDQVAKYIAAGQAEMRQMASLHGWDAATLAAKEGDFISGVHKNIALRLAQSDPLAAERYVKSNTGQLSGQHQYDLQNSLASEVAIAKSKQEADAILSGARRQGSGRASAGDVSAPPLATGRGAGRTMEASGPTQARAFLIGKAGGAAAKVDGLNESFATNVAALFQDAPPGIREGLQVGSGFRSIERQRELWENSDKSGKWVAAPGRSFHNSGEAIDIHYNGQRLDKAPPEVRQWVNDNARKYNLYFPMGHEPWHIEPVGTRGGKDSGVVAARSNVVSPRAAAPSYADIEDRLAGIKDEKVRDLARKRVYAEINVQTKAAEQQEKLAKAELWSYIDKGMTPDQVPMEIRQDAGMAAVSASWGYLNTVASGREKRTDETLAYDMRRYAASKPDEFAQIDLNDYRDRLSKETIKEFTGLQTTALTDQRKAREEGLSLTNAFTQANQQLEAVGITATGKKGEAAQRENAKIAAFQNALAAELDTFKKSNEGRTPTPIETRSMINKLLLPIVVKTPGMIWDTNENKRIFEAVTRSDGSTISPVKKISEIPENLRSGIAIDLARELGRKPSEIEIMARYRDIVSGR
jgi:hypothetical protein